jgi:hypothetical protein
VLGALVGGGAYTFAVLGLSLYAALNNVAPNCEDILSPHAILLAVRAGLMFPGLMVWGQLAAQFTGPAAWLGRYVFPGLFPVIIGGWVTHSQRRGAWALALGWLLVVLLGLTYIGGAFITLVLARHSACR